MRNRWLSAAPGLLVMAASSGAQGAPPETSAPSAEAPAPITLDVAAHLGGVVRLDDPPALEVIERAGFAFGAGVMVAPSRIFSIGLGYEHLSFGRERSEVGIFGAVDLERDLSTVWATLRAHLLRAGPAAIFLGVAPGLVWQSVDATGVTFTGPFAGKPAPFRCEGSASASLALRASIGVDGELTQRLHLVGDAAIDAYRLSSELLDGCAPGAGSATAFGLRAALAYRFDVTRGAR